MKLKPWYEVVKPRADLREGKPLDASEFAVHLDKVRTANKTISKDYTDPVRFFERTYLTNNLVAMTGEVVRRLSGITTEASAVFNTMTQFGGGKTHALTLVYHLAKCGRKANGLVGVAKILERAQVKSVPDHCAVAVFVGTEFDSLNGRGGAGGEPLRKTPWGEIAWQLGASISPERAKQNFACVAEHDTKFIEPKGDVIEKILPIDRPCLILMDEVLSYFSTYRQAGYGTKLYNFIQSLAETCRGRNNCVLIVSAPKSDFDYSYSQEDHGDLQRLEHLLERLSKSILLSGEADASEIIRRRLFEWDPEAVTADGRVLLPKEAEATCRTYGDWVRDNRQQLPNLVNPDLAREQFLASYPFHPMAISVFERKWQGLPRFQRTRGILRLLALWVSRAYQEGYKGAHRDPIITLGTAPVEEPIFRAAVFEELGENRLEVAVTTDIAGRKDANAVRLDAEANEAIQKARLHRKVATTIFFESNGGQVGTEAKEASVPEIRLAVGEPESDIGNIETVLEALTDACYYLTVERTRYRFSLKENLNKRFSDRKAAIPVQSIDDTVRAEVQKIFSARDNVERVFFPKLTSEVSDRPVVTFAIGDLDTTLDEEKKTMALADKLVRENGTTARTFKSAVIWIIADSADGMREEAKKILAWQAIYDERYDLRLDETQAAQLDENLKKAKRDLKEMVWRSYKHVLLLGKDNTLRRIDLGLVHSSSITGTPIDFVVNRLSTDGDIEKGVSPSFLVRHWNPAFNEWSTKGIRDAFFASPLFPRVLNVDAVKDTIARGVGGGQLAYVGKTASGYDPFVFNQAMSPADVEISDEVFVITKETAEAYLAGKNSAGSQGAKPQSPDADMGIAAEMSPLAPGTEPLPQGTRGELFTGVQWSGEVPPQKWMNFYTKVVSRFATTKDVKLTVKLDVSSGEGISPAKIEETKSALRELGLNPEVDAK
jgi:predicted AAA+ superfamily ATPase